MIARDGDGHGRRHSARRRNDHGPPHAATRPAFSLAELMIALAVLGMGLLVIAAALPAGVKYTKQTVDQATGAAAADYAFELIEQNVALRDKIVDPNTAPPTLRHAPTLFQPRFPPGSGDLLKEDGSFGADGILDVGRPARLLTAPNPLVEPIVKVRPLFVQNVEAQPGGGGDEFNEREPEAENAIFRWLNMVWSGGFAYPLDQRECQPGDSIAGFNRGWLRPALPSITTVYPAVTTDTEQKPSDFIDNPYAPQPLSDAGGSPLGYETRKALERRTVWTAFYRRVSYAPEADPALYEFIVVVCRRPTKKHWFPVQDADYGGKPLTGDPEPLSYDRGDYGALTPVPWLVTFSPLVNALPVPPMDGGGGAPGYSTSSGRSDGAGDRSLAPDYEAPASLTFVASAAVGALLPKGSIFIPALNDWAPSALNLMAPGGSLDPGPGGGSDPDIFIIVNQMAGFVPSAPEALPIYTVTDRIARPDGRYDIVVPNNGLSPWVNENANPKSEYWPVWVIPPAAEGPLGNATLSDQSPILTVQRRYVRLRELP